MQREMDEHRRKKMDRTKIETDGQKAATIKKTTEQILSMTALELGAAIKVGKLTRRIIWQNVSLAFGVKLLVLILGAGGIATLWEAVFADVGVALLAIMNAVRIQKMIK